MKTVRDTQLLFARSAVQLLRNPVWIFLGFSTPILYLVLFTPLLKHVSSHAGLAGPNVLDGFLPGILSFLAFASGSGPGFNTIFEVRAGVIERFRVTPASRVSILLGPILASLAMLIMFDIVVIAVGAAFGFDVHLLGLLVFGVLLALMMVLTATFSIATALITKDISSFAAIINFINLPLLLLAGVLLPISIGPLWLRVLAHFNPLYYLVAASRDLGVGHFSGPHVWQAFAVLVPLTALGVAWATRVVRHAVS